MLNRERFLWMLLYITTIIALGVYTVLIRLSEIKSGANFAGTTLFLIIELIKFTFSVLNYNFRSVRNNSDEDIELQAETGTASVFSLMKNSLWYSIPGLFYFINNNLSVYCTKFMDATSYTMLTNFKILSTGILYYLIMGRMLSRQKWISLVLLFSGGVIYVYGTVESQKEEETENKTHKKTEMFITIFGNSFNYELKSFENIHVHFCSV